MNLFIGANAQGKTNLLEAIYVLALTSPIGRIRIRNSSPGMLNMPSSKGGSTRELGALSLKSAISKQGKKASINGLEQRKLSQYIGSSECGDVRSGRSRDRQGLPGIRRRFLDVELGQVYPTYLYHLTQYQKILLNAITRLSNGTLPIRS